MIPQYIHLTVSNFMENSIGLKRVKLVITGHRQIPEARTQLLLKCYFLLFEPNILLHDIMINKSNDVPSKQHENQTSETYDCRSSTRNVSQPKFGKSQSYNTLHFIESQSYNTLHFIESQSYNTLHFIESQSYNTLHFIESQSYNTLHFI